MATRTATLTGPELSLTFTEAGDGGPATSYLTDLTGWYGGVGVKGNNPERTGHGLFPTPNTRTGRTITLKGTITFQSQRDRTIADRVLSGVLWEGEFGTLTVDDGVTTLTSRVKLDGDVRHMYVGTNTTRVEFPLLAPDPFLYGPERTGQVYPAGFGEGLELGPMFGGADYRLATTADYSPRPYVEDPERRPAWEFTETGFSYGSIEPYLPVTPGQKIRWRCYVKASVTGSTAVVEGRYYDAGKASTNNKEYAVYSAIPTEWGLWEYESIVPNGVSFMGIRFYSNHSSGTVTDAVQHVSATASLAPQVMSYGNSVPSSYVTVPNRGNATAWPTFVVRGNFPAGFRLTSGGRAVEYAQPVFAQSPATVDMASGSVTINGQDHTHGTTRREWFSIPAEGIIQPRLTGIQQGDGWADVIVADTYI